MGQPDRQRHEVGRLVAGVAEHHALVARALRVEGVFAPRAGAELKGGVDALCDVGRLAVEGHEHPAGLAVESKGVVVVADVADHVADNRGDVDVGRGRHFTGHKTSPVVRSVSHGHPAGRVASSMASSTASEIWSAILSGWPSVTDSEVKVYGAHVALLGLVFLGPGCGRITLSSTAFGDGIVWTVKGTVVPPPAARMVTALVSWSNPRPRRRHVVDDQEVHALALQLGSARAPAASSVSAANPTSDLARHCGWRYQLDQDVGRWLEDEVGHAVFFGQLALGDGLGAEVRHGGGHDHDVGPGARAVQPGCICVGGSTDHAVDSGGTTSSAGAKLDEVTNVTGAPAEPPPRPGQALLTRRAIGQRIGRGRSAPGCRRR